MNLITMTNITKVYNDGDMQFTALYPTEFYLNEGEFVAIIGPSGSGKTTFLTILGNLQEATSGEITFCGENITNLNEKRKTELRFEEFGSYPKELSGGERQRAAIARALYNNPRVILADEPTASLDTNRAHQVADLLAEIAHKQNKGVVMITHDTRLLDKVDRVYRMEDGHLVEIKK